MAELEQQHHHLHQQSECQHQIEVARIHADKRNNAVPLLACFPSFLLKHDCVMIISWEQLPPTTSFRALESLLNELLLKAVGL